MLQLSRAYPGGSQTASKSAVIRKCGCGVIALADLLLYLTGQTVSDYDGFCQTLQRRYLPILPPFGTTGLSLAMGFDRYCRRHRLPYRARWQVSGQKLWATMAHMLRHNCPVILSIGPNLRGKKLNLYRKTGRIYTATTATKAHYVTVTAMDDQWLQVSSWGKVYYIHREEYWEYGRNYSGFLTHNLLSISIPSCSL